MIPKKLKPVVYGLARKLKPVLPYGILANLAQWLTRYASESDFEVFEWMADLQGLVLDVGASRGQSALSVLRHTHKMHVFSIEPNRKHRWSLLLIRLMHPLRFRFRMVAAGDEFAQKTLYVPGRRASGLSSQGSLDQSEFDKDYVRERLEEWGFDATDKAAFRQVSVRVMPLDGLNLSPDLIKMDVEGFEQQALQGLEKTISNHFPALIIEINYRDRWMPYLQTLGYAFYYYDASTRVLKSYDNNYEELNVFCLHEHSDSMFTRVLLENVST
jgi:FkbM family methyltransferase